MKQANLSILSVVLVFSLLLTSCAEQQKQMANQNDISPTDSYSQDVIIVPEEGGAPGSEGSASSQGRAVFAVTDKAADMGTVTSIMVTIEQAQIHTSSGNWVTVTSEPKTFDLLKLNAEGKLELLADVSLKEGKYNQFRLEISKITVADAKGEHEAKLPSGELRINADLAVKAGTTATAMFDFEADTSLHVTGNGEYIMAPVVKVETKELTDVEVTSDNKVKISGGRFTTSLTVGMDADGNVGPRLEIPANAELEIDAGVLKVDGRSAGKIKVGLGAGKSGSAAGNMSIGVGIGVSS